MLPIAFFIIISWNFLSPEPPYGTPRRERLGFGGVGGRRAPPGNVPGVGTVGTEGCPVVARVGCEVMLSVGSGTSGTTSISKCQGRSSRKFKGHM